MRILGYDAVIVDGLVCVSVIVIHPNEQNNMVGRARRVDGSRFLCKIDLDSSERNELRTTKAEPS